MSQAGGLDENLVLDVLSVEAYAIG